MFFFPRFPSLSSRDVLLIHAKYAKTCSVNLFVCWLQSHEYLVEKREIIMKSNLRLKAKWGITRKESTTDSRWSACCECSLSTASHGLFNICLLKSQRMFVQHLLSIPSSSSFIKGLCLWLFFHGLHSWSSLMLFTTDNCSWWPKPEKNVLSQSLSGFNNTLVDES